LLSYRRFCARGLNDKSEHKTCDRYAVFLLCSAACFFSAPEVRRNPGLAVKVKIVETLGPSPAPPWVVSRTVPAPLRQRLRECLAAMTDDAAGRRILDGWGVLHWRAVDDAAYDAIRTMAREADLLNTRKMGGSPRYRPRSGSTEEGRRP